MRYDQSSYHLAFERLSCNAEHPRVALLVMHALLYRFSNVDQFRQLLVLSTGGVGLEYQLLFFVEQPASIARIIDDDSCPAEFPRELLPEGSVVAIDITPRIGSDPVEYNWEVCNWDQYLQTVSHVISVALGVDLLTNPVDRDGLRELLADLRA